MISVTSETALTYAVSLSHSQIVKKNGPPFFLFVCHINVHIRKSCCQVKVSGKEGSVAQWSACKIQASDIYTCTISKAKSCWEIFSSEENEWNLQMFTEQTPTLISQNVMNRKRGSAFRDRNITAESQHTTVNYNPRLVPWWGSDQKEQWREQKGKKYNSCRSALECLIPK